MQNNRYYQYTTAVIISPLCCHILSINPISGIDKLKKNKSRSLFIGPSVRSSAPSQPSSLASPSVQSFLSPTSPLQPPSLYPCLVLSPISSQVRPRHQRLNPNMASLHPSGVPPSIVTFVTAFSVPQPVPRSHRCGFRLPRVH